MSKGNVTVDLALHKATDHQWDLCAKLSRRRVWDMLWCQQQRQSPADLLVVGVAAGSRSCPRHSKAFPE